jgi:hypothetical protein
MKAIRSLKRWEIVILVSVVLLASSAMAAWFVASEQITANATIKSLTAATYGRARTAQLQVETAPIYWSCDPIAFIITSASGFTANPMTPIWLDSPDKIHNFRFVRSTSTSGTVKAVYFE